MKINRFLNDINYTQNGDTKCGTWKSNRNLRSNLSPNKMLLRDIPSSIAYTVYEREVEVKSSCSCLTNTNPEHAAERLE